MPETVLSEKKTVKRFDGEEATIEIRTDLSEEYVAGGGFPWIAAYIRTLPPWNDDLQRDFGPDIYERMQLDPEVFRSVRQLKLEVLAQDLKGQVAVEEDDPDYELASEIRDFCTANTDRLPSPWTLKAVLYDLLSAIAEGHKLAEQVYEDGTADDTARYPFLQRNGIRPLLLKALKVKPRQVLAFVVDATNNILGIVGVLPGLGVPLIVPGNLGLAPPQQLLPREKFALLTVEGRDSDPRGRGWLRAAYNGWWIKLQNWGPWLKFLAQFGSPSLWATPPPGAAPMQVLDPVTGQPVLNADGTQKVDYPEPIMLARLVQLQNGSVIVVPFGATVQALEMKGDGSAFRGAIEFLNREITAAITGQTLATHEGEHQARAAAQVHQDVLHTPVTWLRSLCEGVVYWDVWRALVRYNYGPQYERLTPVPILSDTSPEDFAKDATAVAALNTSQYFTPSQKPKVDTRLGLPQRTPEETAQEVEAAEAARTMQQQAAENGGQAPQQGDGGGGQDGGGNGGQGNGGQQK